MSSFMFYKNSSERKISLQKNCHRAIMIRNFFQVLCTPGSRIDVASWQLILRKFSSHDTLILNTTVIKSSSYAQAPCMVRKLFKVVRLVPSSFVSFLLFVLPRFYITYRVLILISRDYFT